VIEPCFTDLLSKLSATSLDSANTSGYDPESLRSSHTIYLNNVIDGLFLSQSSLTLLRLLKQLLQHVDAAVVIVQQNEDIDSVRARGLKAVVDECVRELEGVGERDGQGRVEQLLLGLDGGQWFTDNLHQNGTDVGE
jgi:hypothetical protein